MKVSTGMATKTKYDRAWLSMAAGSGEVYAAWSMHGEDAVPGKILPGKGVGWRVLNVWLPLRPNVGCVFRKVTLAY